MLKPILGVNHHFLFPDSITNEKVHTQTLKEVIQFEGIDALDCWIWRGSRSREEIKILRSSDKIINYNIGDRFGEIPICPASSDKREQIRAYDTLMREIEYALVLNSKKIVFASGIDFPEDRERAKENLHNLVVKLSTHLPGDVVLALEPTDRDIDKFFLFGPLGETVDFIKQVRKENVNIGLLLDMCHIPLVHETLESAIEIGKDVLEHVHLGNCVIKDKTDVYYGDKHPAWDYPGGEYSSEDGKKFVNMLKNIGYFDKGNATVSFEMRPKGILGAGESLKKFIEVWKSTNVFVGEGCVT